MFGLHWLGCLFVLAYCTSCWVADCGGLVIAIMLLCYFGFGLVICFDGLVCFACGFVSLLIVLNG